MIITISGLAGSGTTTASKIISEKTGIPYISAGDIFRQMAAEKGMDILEFSKFAEENEGIDIEIDKRQSQIAKEKSDLIIEGRLSAYFVENADLRLWFIAPLDIRTERISHRENKPVEIVKEEIIKRSNSEAKRYQEIHNIDIENMDVYDLIINTGDFKPESIADIILKVVEVISCQQ
ncbi:(d)CMP kinase [Methanobacterium sp. ACI-7]|uniref:(d)CMP kinase n=1 Tax=unclassified Methanobacterium TaxID=2627676 RepID=UPI0039C2CC2C